MNTEHPATSALSGMDSVEMAALLPLDKPFRAKQIYRWIANGARNFEVMTNLSASLRDELSSRFTVFSTSISQTLTDSDGTVKLQIELSDGSMVETVLLTDEKGRKTACVSCQVGCPMGCAFCQTGHIGYLRNLEAAEIIEQFYHLEDSVGKLDNIVFMGMGEPLLNLRAIRKTIAILTDPEGRGLSKRRITISTSGLCEGIISLADEGPTVRLAVSLTTANSELRKSLMPVTLSNPLPELKKAIAYFSEKTGSRVTLEAAVMAGINTDELSAQEMASFARDLNVHINIIPWNPVSGLPFTTPTNKEVRAFVHALVRLGLNATVRMRRGKSIQGACGQLGSRPTEERNDI